VVDTLSITILKKEDFKMQDSENEMNNGVDKSFPFD